VTGKIWKTIMIKKYSSLDSISAMDSGWISPQGKFYSLKNSATNSHDAYAARLVKELRLSNKEERDPLHFLLNKGWLRVHGTNTIPPTINVMFSSDLDHVKGLVKKVYPDFFGELYAELEGGDELYFHGSVDDFFKWTGNKTVAIKKYSQLKVAVLTGEQANRRAIRMWGLTSDPASIGFITPQGSCIDSSGRLRGSSYGGRNIDHRQIAQDALGDDAKESHEETLQEFLDLTGNIRVVSVTNELSIQVPIKAGIPSKKQIFVLEGLAKGKEVYFDITSKGRKIQTGNGKFYVFLNAMQNAAKQDKELKQDMSSNKIPRQLQPLADFVVKNFATAEEYRHARFYREDPLHDALRKVMDKVGLGVTYIWSDFGFNHEGEFFNKVKGQ